jgi:hypothetical protein
LETYYKKILELHNKDGKNVFKWHPYENKADGDEGIESLIPWQVLSAAERMLLVL